MTSLRTLAAVAFVSTVVLALSAPASAASATASDGVAVIAPAAASADSAAWTVIPADNANGAGRGNYAYEVEPGAVIADALVVSNTGSEPLDLTLYAADAFTTTEGVLDLHLADAPKTDAGAWIALEAPSIALQPGESREVAFTITVPAGARPGDHPGGIITSFTSTEEGATLAVDRRLGIRVHLRVAGDLSPQAEIGAVTTTFTPSWNPFAGGDLTVSYELSNTGDTRITAADAVVLAGPIGIGGVASGPEATAEVLPGSSIVVERTISGVAPLGWLSGTLTVAPEGIGIGGAALDTISVEVSTATVSWALIGLLAALVLIALVIIVIVRRRGAHAADA